MATRKTANLPVNYSEQLAAEANDIASRISAPSGDRIRFDGNHGFKTPDGNEGAELEVVIIDFLSSNLFYEGSYDASNPQPPACFAIGVQPSNLVPSPNSPAMKCDSCNACPNNQFGSAGKGKACKNTRLVAMSPVAMDGEDPALWIMSIPPTSLRAFDAYVKSLATKHKTVPIGVITRVSMDSSVTFAAPRFEVVRPLNNEEFPAYMALRDEAQNRLNTEPDVSQFKAAAPAGRTTARRGVR